MTYRPAPVPPGAIPVPAIEARLEPDSIGVLQDVVIGAANAAPAVAVALTLAPLAAAAANGSGPVILACGAPMLVIANSYRQLNLRKANCGASFEWVGRSISPYLGLQIAGTPDPAPDSPRHQGHDHDVGWHAGCPACGRLKAVCARWRAYPVQRSSFAPLRLTVLQLRRARQRPGPPCCRTPGRCSRP